MRYLILFLMLFSLDLNAQKIIFLDALSKRPVEGVSVTSKKQDNGVVSNINGYLDLRIFNPKDTLIIQHLAYQKIEQTKVSIQNHKILLFLKKHSLKDITISETKLKGLTNTFSYLKIKNSIILNTQSSQTSDLLEKSIGINVQKSQSGGGSPNLRGMEANRLLIVVDGIPLNNTIFRSGHVQSISTVNPFFLQDAEVLFGPAAVVYGSGALGGAILLNTKVPKKENSNLFFQQYESSSNTVVSSITSNYKIKKTANITGFAIKSYGNLRMGRNRIHGFSDWGKEIIITEGRTQKETSYHQGDFFHKTLFKLNANFILFNLQFSSSSNINRFDKLNDMYDGRRKYKYWYYGPKKRFFQSIRLKNYYANQLYDESTFTVAYQNIKESRHKQKNGEDFLNNRLESLQIIDLKSDFSKKIKLLNLNYGFDSRFQQLNSKANLSNKKILFYNSSRYPDGGTNVVNNAFYIHINLPLTKKALLLAGTRYSINSLISKFKDTTTIHLPFTEIQVKNKSLSNSIQCVYKLSSKLDLNAAISNGFRNPNTDDIGKVFSKDDASVVVPNNKLSQEKSINIEMGIQLRINELTNLQIQVFQTQIIDAIERREASLNGLDSMNYDGEMMKIMMQKNIGYANITGLNFIYQLNFNRKFSFRTDINLLKGRTGEGVPLAHIPPTNIISNLNYKYQIHTFSLSLHYNALKKANEYDIGGVDNIEEATIIGNPSWRTINLNYRIEIDKSLTLIAGVNNILDYHYKTFGSGISASGRNFTLSLRSKF